MYVTLYALPTTMSALRAPSPYVQRVGAVRASTVEAQRECIRALGKYIRVGNLFYLSQ